MRNLFLATTGLLLAAGACDGGAGTQTDPPVLRVTSPQRSLQQGGAGQITVTGVVTPNFDGDAVEKVLVNDVQATLDAEGNFSAIVTVQPGATLIRTVARDINGGEAVDTRAVHAGELRAAGSSVENALSAAISTDSFAKIAAAAGPLIQGMDLGAMLAPMNPMVRSGDEAGPDCLFGQLFINDVNFSDVDISLIPTAGGIEFRAQIDDLDVPGRARYAAACVDGDTQLRVKASRVTVAGTLLVSPKGNGGFETQLDAPDVTITGLDIQASGIPGNVLDLLNIESTIQGVIAKGAELAMEPMMNQAMGALAGPKTMIVLGKELTMEVVPTDISFDVTGGVVAMDTSLSIKGAEAAKFVFTPNGRPSLDPSRGFQIGLADDFANQMLAEAVALGLLNLSMPTEGGPFDTTSIAMSLPPMISADPVDGKLRVIIGDMMATFLDHGTPVGKAAISVKLDLEIKPAAGGFGVEIVLGKPDVNVNVLDDIENTTRLSPEQLSRAVSAVITAQVSAMSTLLRAIPLPSVAGLQMKNLSVGSDSGYVMVNGSFQ